MSSVRGTISVDVAFTDSTTVSGAQSLKTITLRDATEYTSGKVAIVTGTVGTAVSTIANTLSLPYRNASGDTVAFTSAASVKRLVFMSDGRVEFFADNSDVRLVSHNHQIASTLLLADGTESITAQAIGDAGTTASYTVVIYGT